MTLLQVICIVPASGSSHCVEGTLVLCPPTEREPKSHRTYLEKPITIWLASLICHIFLLCLQLECRLRATYVERLLVVRITDGCPHETRFALLHALGTMCSH